MSTATYTNKAGVLVTAALDEPRFEKEGILIEGASTNLVTNSHDGADGDAYNDAIFSIGVGEVFFGEPTSTVSLSGSSPNTRVTFSAPNNPSGVYTVQARVKGVEGEMVRLQLEFPDHSPVKSYSTDHVFSGGWDHITVSGESLLNDQTVNLVLRRESTINSVTFDVGLLQIEELPFATSYIPTTDSPATRAGEEIVTKAENNLPQISELTVSSYISSSREEGIFNKMFGVQNGTVADFRVELNPNTGEIQAILIPEGGTTEAYQFLAPDIDVRSGATFTFVFSEDSVSCYRNGTLFSAPINRGGDSYKGQVDPNLYIGGGDGGSQLNGHTRDFRIWHSALTPEQVSTL